MIRVLERQLEGRHEEAQRDRPPAPPPEVEAALRYLLGTTVPPYWFPLVPVNSSGDLRLQLQRMANQPATAKPLGVFLDSPATEIADASVPREGRRLVRDYAFTRWS